MCGGLTKPPHSGIIVTTKGKEMTNYYLSIGYGKDFVTGVLDKATLPMTEDDVITDGDIHMSDDPFDYDTVRDEALAKLQNGDTLTIAYRNQAALWLLDEDIEEFHIPDNQREELWNSEGLVDTYTYFTNTDNEEWGFLVNE